MSKFYGAIGYSVTEEIRPGVWGEKITVRDYYGDVIRNTRQYQSSDNLNDNLNVSNEFSIVADPFAYANFHSSIWGLNGKFQMLKFSIPV